MSVGTVIYVRCDECGREEYGEWGTAQNLRRFLREQGWTSDTAKRSHRIDRCADCVGDDA